MNSTIKQALWKKGLEGISGLGEDWRERYGSEDSTQLKEGNMASEEN